jgi:hypothetical protein
MAVACHTTAGDSAGFVKVWDLAPLAAALLQRPPAANAPTAAELQQLAQLVVELALWRAHSTGISCIDWVLPGQGTSEGSSSSRGKTRSSMLQPDAAAKPQFLVCAAGDCTASVWREDGACVGVLGQPGAWSLEDPGTWKHQERQPLDVSVLSVLSD